MAGVHPREYLRKDRGEGVQTVKMLRSLPHCIGGVLGLACSDCGFESVRSKVKPKTMTLVLVVSSLHKGLKSQIKNRLAKTGPTFPMSYVMVIFVFSEFS